MRKITALLSIALMLLPLGCGADQIIAGLETAQKVAQQAQIILAPVNPEVANISGVVATDLGTLIKAYQDYEAAAGSDKPTRLQIVNGLVSALNANLAQILDAVRVKNPALLTEITVFVAVANSAVIALVAKLSGMVKAQSAIIGPASLPIIPNAKSAKDLKKAWNQAAPKANRI